MPKVIPGGIIPVKIVMDTVIQSREEKAELEAVLSSETFLKSPNLAKLLSYICNKYFDGCAGELKEYNIGVEAMGRPANFDPTVNSTVRVDAHRLREKLKKYYESAGADHAIVITLHVGHYVPQFIRRDGLKIAEPPNGAQNSKHNATPIGPVVALEQPTVSESPGSLQLQSSPPTSPLIRLGGMLAIIAAIVVVMAGALIVWKLRPLSPRVSASGVVRENEKGIQAVIEDDQAVRILAGYSKDKYIDRSGKVWQGDRYFTGGTAGSQPRRFIARTLDPTLYQTFRIGDFSYDIPLKAGVYELRLYFAEPYFGPDTYVGGGESSRIFSIELNGKPLLNSLDVLRDAGGDNISYVRVFKDIKPDGNGFLHFRFFHSKDESLLNALEIVPGLPGKMQPIRIVAQDSSYTDREGRVWSPDSYFSGGRLIYHKGPANATTDPDIYAGERYGNFSYALPVAPGKYTVTLRFAETYFGPENPGAGGVGSRVFDIFANGVVLLRNFDIFKEAGGANRALDKSFRGLEPNAQGNILLTFAPVENYACVNAIEVVDGTN